MIRNLIVHCYPRRSGMWRRTLAHLTAGRRWQQFTGRKIVTIALDHCTADGDAVAAEWPAECEIIFRRNDCAQEVGSFLPMLERLASRAAEEFTTYVHCKGATQSRGYGSHGWLDFMAAANLDYPRLLECFWQRGANIAGAFRVNGGAWALPGNHGWHYAGTWFTFRHSRIFGALDWRNVHGEFFGVEAWPGIVPFEESACLFWDDAATADLYSPAFQALRVRPAMNHWRRALAAAGLDPLAARAPNLKPFAPLPNRAEPPKLNRQFAD